MEKLEQAYLAYFLDVYRYALRLCGERMAAEDLTSATFLRAMDKLHTFRGEGELRVWLCSIARNLRLSALRRQGREIPLDAVPEPADWADTASLVAEKDAGRRALAAALALNEPARRVFLLRALHGQPFNDIGRDYGKNANWACVVYHRARKSLMQALEETDET